MANYTYTAYVSTFSGRAFWNSGEPVTTTTVTLSDNDNDGDIEILTVDLVDGEIVRDVWSDIIVSFRNAGNVTGWMIRTNSNLLFIPIDGTIPSSDNYVWSRIGSTNNLTTIVLCFTRGTLIKTQTGERLVEDLSAGDMVLTMDHGYQPIRWIGSSKRPATGNMAPILIRKGALGNDRDLRVSPQHRMLLQGWQAELLYGEREVLATAQSLVNDHSIIRVEGGEVEYFHILFDTHEIIYAEGAPSESFHPGEQGWKALDEPTRNEILELFPELSDGDFASYGPSARFNLKHKEGQLLGQYMLQENEAKLNA